MALPILGLQLMMESGKMNLNFPTVDDVPFEDLRQIDDSRT